MHHSIKLSIIAVLFTSSVYQAEAFVPVIVEQESLDDIMTIEDPALAQVLYGQLTNFPHTFQIVSPSPFHLFVQILLPDIESSINNVSGIIIKENERGGRVVEITRMSAKESDWETTYEPTGGDTYRSGSIFEKDLEPGTYRIEVQTPDNIEKYVLAIGQKEEITIGYFEHLKRLVQVKQFFNKSVFRIIESMYVYIPAVVLLTIGSVVWYIRRRKVST